MYYNARWYDPALGRFAQADTIVPAGVQGYDRYAYVNNNPVRYTDPSGHESGDCWDRGYCTKKQALRKELDKFKEPKRVKDDEMIPYLGKRLSPEENRLIHTNHSGPGVAILSLDALDKAEDRFDVLLNSPGDAFRHAYWNGLITSKFGEDFARAFTTAHETQYDPQHFPDAREQSFMDLHNNEVGIRIAVAHPNSSNVELQDLVMDALVSGQLVVWDGNDIYYSDQCPMCIYP